MANRSMAAKAKRAGAQRVAAAFDRSARETNTLSKGELRALSTHASARASAHITTFDAGVAATSAGKLAVVALRDARTVKYGTRFGNAERRGEILSGCYAPAGEQTLIKRV